MKLLHLMRHAKSSWGDEGLADHERPLAPRGRRAARAMAAYLRGAGIEPSLVLCSSARRARQTLDLILPALGEDVEVLVEEGLYGAPATALLERIRGLAGGIPSVMLIGHNPGLQELVVALARPGKELARLRDKFPTGALASLGVEEDSWADLREGGAVLLRNLSPRDLSNVRST